MEAKSPLTGMPKTLLCCFQLEGETETVIIRATSFASQGNTGVAMQVITLAVYGVWRAFRS